MKRDSLIMHAIDNAPTGMALIAPDGRWLTVNLALSRMTGYAERELLAANLQSLTHPEDLERMCELMGSVLEGTVHHGLLEQRIYHKEGGLVPVLISFSVIRDGKGNPLHYFALFQTNDDGNTTELLRTSRQLREQQALYKLITDHAQDLISYASPEGTIRYVSPSVTALLGYEPNEIIGKSNYDFWHPDDVRELENWDVLKDNDTDMLTCRFRHKQGHYIWFESTIRAIRNEKGDIEKILGIARDISERKQIEQLMLQSEKLSIAGQLAAGIAHEIRNPLTAIKGFMKLLDRKLPEKPYYLDIVHSEMNRIEMILNELLILAKPQAAEYRTADLREIVEQVVTLMESQALMRDVLIRREFAEDKTVVPCDENQLKQVFINFVKNAIEAMPDGGTLTIAVAASGGWGSVTIIDQGCGIPEDQLKKLGEPFYTTKEKGTGLGFLVSKKIVASHNGEIRVRSEVGRGTEVEVILPLGD